MYCCGNGRLGIPFTCIGRALISLIKESESVDATKTSFFTMSDYNCKKKFLKIEPSHKIKKKKLLL